MKLLLLSLSAVLLLTFTSCSSGESGKSIATTADAEESNQKGVQLMNEDRLDEALEVFREGLTDQNISTEMKAKTYRNIALAFTSMEEKDSAIRYFDLALKFIPKNSYEYLVNQADLDIISENIPEAIEKLDRALAMDSEKVPAHDLLGEIYMGNYGKEYRELDKALEHNLKVMNYRKDETSEFMLGKNYFLMDNLTDAYSHFDNLVMKHPDDPVYLLHKAMVMYRQGDRAEAEKIFKNVIQMNPDEKDYIERFKEVYG